VDDLTMTQYITMLIINYTYFFDTIWLMTLTKSIDVGAHSFFLPQNCFEKK